MNARRWLQRLLAMGRAGRLDRELDDEIAAHLEMAERDGVAAGRPAEEARRLASRVVASPISEPRLRPMRPPCQSMMSRSVLTSNRPTPERTAACSASTPPPAYSMGIDQPLKSASLAPAATCRSWRGEVSRLIRPR